MEKRPEKGALRARIKRREYRNIEWSLKYMMYNFQIFLWSILLINFDPRIVYNKLNLTVNRKGKTQKATSLDRLH
jgi:hypothetical protein